VAKVANKPALLFYTTKKASNFEAFLFLISLTQNELSFAHFDILWLFYQF
jgi:hypothetical protein